MKKSKNALLKMKSELGLSHNVQTHNGIKNKVLENFDVKTTKSNMLASMPYIIEMDLEGGKLVSKHEHCYVVSAD